MARISEVSGTPRSAAFYVLLAVIVGYAVMRVAFHASGSNAFFWGSTLGALALLVAYLFVVVSAAGALLRGSEQRMRWMLFILALAAAVIAYTFWVNVAGAYRVIPWIVLAWCCAPVVATFLHPPAARSHQVRFPGRTARLTAGATLYRALLEADK